MTTSQRHLVEKAKEILREKGFTKDEIYERFWFKNYRISAVGWSPKQKVAVECSYCSPEKREDLGRFFDEVVCLSLRPQTRPVLDRYTPATSNVLAKIKLMLVEDENVIFEVPLSREELPREFLENEMNFVERDFQHFSKFFDALSHRNRLRMMKLLIENENLTMGFAEFIRDLGLNPKLVWENTRKLRESGLLRKNANGRYRCSEFGEASFIMLSLVLRRLRNILEDIEGR
ncbi:MAG: winged helix-turn-helix transcriptional regulator [Candidatus Bathyarchaeota archaeon]|nr:MAG: winged helix-turn-helix transcriptional regulator [Candidatus Bathyarchaeota archaeon]